MNRLKLFFFLMLCGCAVAGAGISRAEEAAAPKSEAQESEALSDYEKTVFSFFKLTNGTPDFKKIIEVLDRYVKENSKYVKNKIYEKENLRLKWGFGSYEPDKDYIKIKTKIFVQITPDFKVPMLNFKFMNAQDDKLPYFPYPYGYEWITIMPNDMEKFQYLPLTKDHYKKIKPFFDFKRLYDATMELHVRPVAASNAEPMIVDGVKQWPVFADIASITFTYDAPDGQKIVLGSYEAPWYEVRPGTNIDALIKAVPAPEKTP
ncbi:MAG: hypothetical protein K9G62_04855 [Alphaproteobacteria bacterium]|nr:hypothetical protein [Alphaproteobacteria bacterium]